MIQAINDLLRENGVNLRSFWLRMAAVVAMFVALHFDIPAGLGFVFSILILIQFMYWGYWIISNNISFGDEDESD